MCLRIILLSLKVKHPFSRVQPADEVKPAADVPFNSKCICNNKTSIKAATTNPSSPGEFHWCSADSSARGAHQKVITYSLFGTGKNENVSVQSFRFPIEKHIHHGGESLSWLDRPHLSQFPQSKSIGKCRPQTIVRFALPVRSRWPLQCHRHREEYPIVDAHRSFSSTRTQRKNVPLFGDARSRCGHFHIEGHWQCHLASEGSRRCWSMAKFQFHFSFDEGSQISQCHQYWQVYMTFIINDYRLKY